MCTIHYMLTLALPKLLAALAKNSLPMPLFRYSEDPIANFFVTPFFTIQISPVRYVKNDSQLQDSSQTS